MVPSLTGSASTLLVVGAALALQACALAAPAPGDVGAAPPCPATRGQLVLDRINEIRAGRGLTRLAVESRLVTAALGHSADQADQGPAGVGHIGSDGSAPGDRVSGVGYAWSLVAENVAAGLPSPESVVTGWMDSAPHRATILSPGAVHAGIGYTHRYEGLNHFWTLVVAAPRDPRNARLLACHP